MTCCIFGVLLTALVVWVRRRVLRQKAEDPTAWHLPLPPRAAGLTRNARQRQLLRELAAECAEHARR